MSANTAAGNPLEFVEMKRVVETFLPNEADDYVGDGPVRCFSGRPRRTAAEQAAFMIRGTQSLVEVDRVFCKRSSKG
jgi:hypothetical protein